MLKQVKKAISESRKLKRAKRQSEVKKRHKFPEMNVTVARAQQYKPRYRYSVVTAAYGAESYLDDFFSSLMQQTVGFVESIQVVLVDDGSTDGTLEKARVWEARYPDSIKVITQENGGPAAARNTGLPHAVHEWITFTDPDDFLASDYFEAVDRSISANQDAGIDVDMVACRIVTYREGKRTVDTNHALNSSFEKGSRVVSFVADQHNDLKLQAASCVFRRESICASMVKFRNIKPSFEDAVFIVDYVLSLEYSNVLFLPSANYFYRKREDNSSLVDTAWSRREKYVEQIKDGYLALFNRVKSSHGYIPRWVQRTVFYDLAWHFKVFTNKHKDWALVPKEIEKDYFELLIEVFSEIDEQVIRDFELVGLPAYMKMGILALCKNTKPEADYIHVMNSDINKQEVLFGVYHVDDQVDPQFKLGGKVVHPFARKARKFEFLGRPLVYETLLWVRFAGDGELTASLNGLPVPLRLLGRHYRGLALRNIVPAFQRKKIANLNRIPLEKRAIRWIAVQEPIVKRYQSAWLLMDRDTQADDNAEHLYRYLQTSHPDVNAWFVLRKSSHDWKRLSEEGFKLLDYGSLQHKIAMLNADHLISSHADHYLFSVVPPRFYTDLTRYRYTFLQHGVTHNDLSGWLNSKNIACFITAASREFNSLVAPGTYKFTAKEVALTGFPRHDVLLRKSKEASSNTRKRIVIMPTWRQGLAGDTVGQGNARLYNQEFRGSDYFRNWQAFLAHERLHALSDRYGVELVFFPHANLESNLQDFDTSGLNVMTHSQKISIQELLIGGDLLITDYSSVAFDFALLKKPIAYFQFDRDFVFGGGHTTRKGYFDYDRDGFGSVEFSADDLVETVERIIVNGFVAEPLYAARMKEFFPFRDGRNCERVVARIKALDTPEPSVIDVVPA